MPLADNPLSVTHRRQLSDGRDQAKRIRKAARVAAFNGWSTGAIAALSAMFLLMDRSFVAIAMTAGLAIVAYNEFRGRNRLLKFDPSAATLLGWNQVGLLAMIVAYCLWMLFGGSADEAAALSAQMKSAGGGDLMNMAGDLEGLYKTVTLGLYGGTIVLSLIFQGGNALYYFTRRRLVEEFVAQTPEWAREIIAGG